MEKTDKKTIHENTHPDSRGFIQNHPDSRGFAPGKRREGTDGKWCSNHPDAHGWNYSSSK